MKSDEAYPDEIQNLVYALVTQAVYDFTNYLRGRGSVQKEHFTTAAQLIFDPYYKVQWGDIELTSDQLCSLIGKEIIWIREHVRSRLKELSYERKSRELAPDIYGQAILPN